MAANIEKYCMASLIWGNLKKRKLESRVVVAMGRVGRCWSKGPKFQLCRVNSSGDLIYIQHGDYS